MVQGKQISVVYCRGMGKPVGIVPKGTVGRVWVHIFLPAKNPYPPWVTCGYGVHDLGHQILHDFDSEIM
jgi:hypothetical protein